MVETESADRLIDQIYGLIEDIELERAEMGMPNLHKRNPVGGAID